MTKEEIIREKNKFSSQSERVKDNESDDMEWGKQGEGWLSKGWLIRSWFQRQGDAYWKEWFVILREERVGEQARVTCNVM